MAMEIEVTKLAERELPAAIAVVARGMRDNPINVRAVGEVAEAQVLGVPNWFMRRRSRR